MQNFYRIRVSNYLKKYLIPAFIRPLLIMVLMLQIIMPASAADGQTIHNVHISFVADNMLLKDVFRIIEQKTDFIIAYDNTIDINKKVSIHVTNESVSQILQKILKDYKGVISQVDDHHVIIKVEKAPASQKHTIKVEQTQIKITGIVTDDQNEPLPGVSVHPKNSGQGTTTDVNGKYSLMVNSGSVLVFSFVGYQTQEIVVKGDAINVKLTPQKNMLTEVVAIGYQSVRKSDVTGAISSVKASELNLSAPTLGQALVGKVAGVQISQTDGAPYQSPKIRVRGIGSFNASSDPLYVIDGYPAGNDLFVNPDDIESIDILKDAASAAIYGSRASGGVVLITTKHGKDGKGKFEYDVQTGVSQLAHKVKLLNSDQFAQLVIDGRNNTYHDLWVNSGKVWNDAMYSDNNATRVTNVGNASSVQIPTTLYDFTSQQLIPQTVNTDWQDELYHNAFYQKHNLSFSGGANGVHYYVSGAYQNQDGIIRTTGQERYNFRTNIDGDVNKRLHVAANVSYTQNTNHEVQEGRFDHGPILGALIYMPFFPAYNADGSLATNAAAAQSSAYGYQSIENPVALAERTKITRKGQRSTYNASATYQILPGLSFKANLGDQTYNEKYDYYLPTNLSSGVNPPGSTQAVAAANAVAQTISQEDRLGEFTLNYNKQFGKNHIDLLAGYTAQKTTSDVVSVTARGFQNDNVPEITAKGAGDANYFTLNSATGKSVSTLLSYLGRANYSYDGKYFLTGSFRADGSSRFGPENKYGYFPSVAAGWTVSQEPFYHDWLGQQSTVKLRASWGLSGNYNIGNYNFQQAVANPTGVVFGNNTIVTATYAGGLTDPKLSWESTSQYNFGMDLGLLKGRLFVIANYYVSYSYNLLYNQPISAIGGSTTSGATTILTNLHDSQIRNNGLDLQLDGKIIKSKDFAFNASGNISFNRNKVTKLSGNNTIIINGAERSYLTNITVQGQPVGMFYGFKVAGRVTADNIGKVAPSASSTNPLKIGDLYFVDTDGNGVVNDADKTVIGTPYPKFTYGFNLNASYKMFDISSSFNGSYGNQVLDGQDYYLYNGEGSGNQYADVADRYRNAANPGNGTSLYRASRGGTQSNSTRLSTVYLQSGSFLRCTDITLGYTLPKLLDSKLGISNVRVFASVVNAFTITKYKGYNPEVDYNYSSGASNSTQPANLAPGIDYGVYPLVRSYNMGIRVIF
ncbi:SusC/RagA family TonB-linked outer membrane protein [Mucilaginibacter paludis]|uniref:TonB-dependent receptor plug n=1 Tax=Mucilaginibacter paludis DSM 18603 TaxID=714943 RepID=H1Y5U6_9SPHI|nr:SusC/RagA family TonB-linked outer membrane protein [Mucilaginibacter paludis]EHQ30368.1 TonB-dependent receptor plug [Mucilaginibacter paludis DSM 18603]